jgi:hypothetical protein
MMPGTPSAPPPSLAAGLAALNGFKMINQRKLQNHVLVNLGHQAYHLLNHPELMVQRYREQQQRAVCMGWRVLLRNEAVAIVRTLDDVDAELGKFNNCADCGKFDRTRPDRTGKAAHRCTACWRDHDERQSEYASGAAAVKHLNAAWELAEKVRNAPSVEQAAKILMDVL